MDLLVEAPAVPVLLSLCLSLPWSSRLPPLVMGAIAALFALGSLMVLSVKWEKRRYVMAALVTTISFVVAFYCSVRLDGSSPFGPIDSTGIVVAERSWGRGRAMVIDTSEGRFVAKVPAIRSSLEGTELALSGEVVPLRGARDKGGFDERLYWLARGVSGELIVGKSVDRGRTFSLGSLRSNLRRRILLRLPPLTRGYLLASLLGGKDPDLEKSHRRWGTAHLLAVSGFHVGVAAALAWVAFRRLRLAWLFVSAVVWLYVLLAGGAASSVRAALMIQLATLGPAIGRPSSGVNSVALAAIALLAWRPWWFWDLGWRLSVSCALVVTAMASIKGVSTWKKALAMSPILWVVTAPMIAGAFGSVSANGLLLNLVALPVFAVLLPLAVLCSLPVLLGLPGGDIFTLIPEGAFELWALGADSIPFVSVGWNPWFPALAVGVVTIVMILRFRIPIYRGGVLLLVLVSLEKLLMDFL
ncbi:MULTISPECIES: ComEC/Rec2 family competence protein [Dethiosulfovibrio]|uniref:Competence protein ComEC family protein n=2 Tax=Dethiosulfovibrio TaxID=47054 RepID=A0ABS9EKS1_9BACT|nr:MULTISPECIES: ComEC/Rec2 family competence protein [Dethiosulfovibrio]MCF4113779.1 competence protein ComEC family protein [Dethiosulfovibrio russensis]MCF4141808.1 competence protein ComEC family protein [Dethiosulfovibrio marinus]MCF4143774.1 competence protein ComEC family protein [Dethiosulfovibrio acidaminovorans]